MKGENLIHLKFEYAEALRGKKEILLTQKNLVNLLGIVKKYHEFRSDEIKVKIKLHSKIKELANSTKKLQDNFPKVDVEKVLGKEHERNDGLKHPKEKQAAEEKKPRKVDNSLEAQLREIQKRLNAISG